MSQLTAILKPLHRMHRRERLHSLAWAGARLFALALVLVFAAGAIDWWIDLRQETPKLLRFGLLAIQLLITSIAAVWLFKPILQRRDDDKLALFVEDQIPAFHHRLISAVQLNRATSADSRISKDLIAAVTREASQSARQVNFAALVNNRRIRLTAIVFGTAAVAVAMTVILAPQTLAALLARQVWLQREIPRSVRLTNRTNAVQPSGEPVVIKLAIDGPWPGRGEIQLLKPTGSTDRLEITDEPDNGVLTARIPAPASDFEFEAWVGDGRLCSPGRVKLVPRPAVVSLDAALILPNYCGLKPDGSRYEVPQPRGEVTGVAGCWARTNATTQKPVVRAELSLISSGEPSHVTRTINAKPVDGQALVFSFELREDEIAYRIDVWDEYGFTNIDPPRRDVRLLPEEPPVVALLPEQFKPEGYSGASEDFEADGVPVPLGSAIRIGYTAHHGLGLGQGFLVYRINEGDWHRLRLSEVTATDSGGPFDLKRGCFHKSLTNEQIQFHAVPSVDVTTTPSRIDGGGRFDFQTRGLPGIKVGDQLEYFIEVTNRNPEQTIAGRSETRSKRVVSIAELVEWIDATLRQEDRIRRLTDRQRGVFDK